MSVLCTRQGLTLGGCETGRRETRSHRVARCGENGRTMLGYGVVPVRLLSLRAVGPDRTAYVDLQANRTAALEAVKAGF